MEHGRALNQLAEVSFYIYNVFTSIDSQIYSQRHSSLYNNNFFYLVGSCVTLLHPANGQVIITNTEIGGHAIFSCVSGYNLVGTIVRVCQVSGTWSLEMPTCQCKSLG